MNPANDILSIKGVGEKTARLFRKIGIDTVEDLIHDYPRDYVVYPEPTKLKAAQDDRGAKERSRGKRRTKGRNWNRFHGFIAAGQLLCPQDRRVQERISGITERSQTSTKHSGFHYRIGEFPMADAQGPRV